MSGPGEMKKAIREGGGGTPPQALGAPGGKDAALLPRVGFSKGYGTFHLATLPSSATLAAGKRFHSLMQ